jgi:GNAT superfamily N-acetyltransferase
MTDTPQTETPQTGTPRTGTPETDTPRTDPPRTDPPSLAEGYEISTDPARIDVERVHRWLSTDAYWALGRSRDKQERAIARSLNFGVYEVVSGHQVAFARVVTDLASFAWLCDVYVDREARGKGIGTALVGAVREHLRPYDLKRVLLATHDAHGVYEKLGFRPLERPDQWMAHFFD